MTKECAEDHGGSGPVTGVGRDEGLLVAVPAGAGAWVTVAAILAAGTP
jgi:hypothetical protein